MSSVIGLNLRLSGLWAVSIALFALALVSGYTNQTALEVFFFVLGLVIFLFRLGMAVEAYNKSHDRW